MKGDIKDQMPARWAVFELAMKLGLATLGMEEHDVTESIDKNSAIAGATIYSYRVDPISFWVYVLPSPDGELRISVMTRRIREFGYYKFIFSPEGEFQRIRKLQVAGPSFRWES